MLTGTGEFDGIYTIADGSINGHNYWESRADVTGEKYSEVYDQNALLHSKLIAIPFSVQTSEHPRDLKYARRVGDYPRQKMKIV